MTQKIYIKPYETVRTEPEGECVAYYHEDYVRALSERNEQLKLEYEVLEGCVQNRLIDLGFGRCATFSEAFDAIKSRIADLEAQLAEARESAVG